MLGRYAHHTRRLFHSVTSENNNKNIVSAARVPAMALLLPHAHGRKMSLFWSLETFSMKIRGYLLDLDDLGNGAPPSCDFR